MHLSMYRSFSYITFECLACGMDRGSLQNFGVKLGWMFIEPSLVSVRQRFALRAPMKTSKVAAGG